MPIEHLTIHSGRTPAPPRRRRFRWAVFFAVFIGIALVILIAGAFAIGSRLQTVLKNVKTVALALPPEIIAVAPELIKDKTVLFLLLNNTELRPGGGFIGSVGIADVRGGALASFDTHDVYALDRFGIGTITAVPPEPIKKYLNVKAWYLRDANWSPDFAASAVEVLRAYGEEAVLAGDAYPSVDAVVGVTPDFFIDLLRLTGPISVSGVTFTPENLTDELEYHVERRFLETGTPREQRKEIVGELGRELVVRLKPIARDRFPELLTTVLRAFREKHLMVFDKDPAAQRRFDALGWTGRVSSAPGDFLMVVDANLASLKSDPAVKRTISYRLEPDGSGLRATATMQYVHHGRFDWKTTRYRTYTRFLVPRGAVFISGSGAMENDKLKDPARRPGKWDIGEESGQTSFGAFISVEPGETRELSVTYRLPAEITDAIGNGVYTLLVQKQLGTAAHGLTLDLGFGKKLTSAAPPEEPSRFGDDRYALSTDLVQDRTFNLRF